MAQSVDEVLAKIDEVLQGNNLLKTALENAIQAMLNASSDVGEQLEFIAKFISDTPQDITTNLGTTIPNLTKIYEKIQSDIQAELDKIPADYESVKQETQAKLTLLLETRDNEAKAGIQAIKEALQREADAIKEATKKSLDNEKQEYITIKAKLQDELNTINSVAFLKEFEALKKVVQRAELEVIEFSAKSLEAQAKSVNDILNLLKTTQGVKQ